MSEQNDLNSFTSNDIPKEQPPAQNTNTIPTINKEILLNTLTEYLNKREQKTNIQIKAKAQDKNLITGLVIECNTIKNIIQLIDEL